MRHSVFIYFILFFIGVSLIGGSVLTTYTQFVEEGPLTEAKTVVIPKGLPLKQTAALLKTEGVITSPAIFILGVRASGNTMNIKAGEYEFPRHASAKMAMDILTAGQTVIRRFIAPEGLTSAQIIESMDLYRGLNGSVDRIPRNGTLLPDTYHYSFGDTKESIVSRMEHAMTRTLAELWEKRNPNIALKTPQEAVIMASIVEKETSRDKERGLIASVFYNRMKQGIRLQSDPTVIYAVTDGRLDLKRRLTYKDLRVPHPYNTYVIYGLPEGPIANPGRASLEAVLNPPETEYLYFVADGTGGHVFAKTYQEHQKNVENWRKIRKRKTAASSSVKKATIPAPAKMPSGLKEKETERETAAELVDDAKSEGESNR